MGVKQSPDFAQEIMEDALRDVEEADVHTDDVVCFDKSWEAHLCTLRVLSRLQGNNFAVNPLKCEWAVEETDFLGCQITDPGPRGLLVKVTGCKLAHNFMQSTERQCIL
jgi:hypothetical protein